jgi:N-acetylmuramoyl-L-alanine amidase
MKKKISYILVLVLLAVLLGLLSGAICATTTNPATLLKEADQCRKTLNKSSQKKRYRHNWVNCARRYKKIYARYPGSDKAAWAIYHSAGLYTGLYAYSGMSKDIDEALDLYEQLVDKYRKHRLADDAQYRIGQIYYECKKDEPRAYREFQEVERKFPTGDMRPKAEKMLDKLAKTVKKSGVPSAAPQKPATILKEANQCRDTLLRSKRKKKFRQNWLACIERYKGLYSLYPQSDQATWAIYHSAGLYTGLYAYSGMSKDIDEALDLYGQLVDKYKKHRLADDAQYRIGEIYYRYKKNPSQAYVEFLKVDIKFPSGDMRPKARKMLDKLAVTLSKVDAKKETKVSGAPETGLIPVRDIRYWSTANYTRIVIDLKSPVKYEHHLIKADPDHKKPRRLYLDLKKSQVTSQIDRPIDIKDGLLQRARAGQYTKDTVRVVLDIESIGGYKVFHLHDPFRIVVDVGKRERIVSKAKSRPAVRKRTPVKGVRKAEAPDRTVSLARQLGLNVKRIVIDPGHGGKDPGCFARGGIKEKSIVLSIAKLLAKKIEKKFGCEVFLTRTRDVFLSLEQRTAVANMKKADLFISLHINAHRDRRIQGLETYFLNMATDKRAIMVAARENATSEKNISDLQTILNDLMLNTKIHESSRLAHAVQKGMVGRAKKRYKKIKDLGVKQAPFYVLIGAQMPAILVETGFLTNATERKRLVSKRYQESMADGICEGIRAYISSIDQVYKGG